MEALLSAWDEAWGMRWSPTVVSCSVILHHCKVRSVRLSISHGLVMHLGPRQPSSLPFWEALWLRPSVTFLQQTISEAPTAPANSSPAWFQSPPNGLNPVLTPFLSPDKFYNCQISQGEHQNKKKNYRWCMHPTADWINQQGLVGLWAWDLSQPGWPTLMQLWRHGKKEALFRPLHMELFLKGKRNFQWGSVMVNFMGQLDWVMGCSGI